MPETIPCASCGSENPVGNRFCGSCGAALPGSSGAPVPAAERAPAASPVPLEERRVATVLFADLSGFTELSGRTDPEDVRAFVDACMELLGEVIERYGGFVDKVIGDAVMAVWGVPTSREDHAERAVRAALDMQQCTRDHPDTFAGLALRIGVNTGELMFAPVGPRGRRDQTVMGDVVNVASRLQTSAPRGGVLVGEETWRETRRAIRYEQVEPFTVKGKDDPLDGWLAIAPLAAVPSGRPLSVVPMVGRDRELELLTQTWHRVVERAQTHFVVVSGAPGVGKSRLCRELRLRVEAEGSRVTRSRSLPYGEGAGYGAFAEMVKHASGVLDSDDSTDALAKLARRLPPTNDPSRRAQVAGALATMVGLGPGEATSRAVVFEAALEFIVGLGAGQPLLLVFEDIHWADATLVDLLEHLASRLRDVPVLILASARPELFDARPQLGRGTSHYTSIALDALDPRAAGELAREVLRGRPVSPAALERIGDVAGGNPLFIEELATSVAEGTTDATGALPTSLVSIIAARLDAVPHRQRQLLLNAAVIGRVFWRDLLASLDPADGLDDALRWLEERDYVRHDAVSEIEGDQAYSFRHVLLREVAYNTLPRAARRTRHATIARIIETRFPDRPRALAPILAHHWGEAGETDRAIDYLLEAADQASQAWAKREAVVLYSQALDLLAENDPRSRAVSLRRALADQQIRHVEFGDVEPPTGVGDVVPS